MAPLRVLLLNNYLPPRGGAEAHVQQVHDLLKAAGHDVELLAPGDAAGGWADVRDRVRNPDLLRLVRERIREKRPDVIHVHNFLRRVSVAPFVAAHRAGVPTVLTVHDFQLFCPRTWAVRGDGSPCDEPKFSLCAFGDCRGGLDGIGGRARYALNAVRLRWAAGVVAREATRILSPSKALAVRLATSLDREIGHLPHPFPPAEPFEAPTSPALLFLGRVSREKGLREFLSGYSKSECEVPLTVAGDGPDLEAVKREAKALGQNRAVRFEGWVDAARAKTLLREHGALVVPSLWLENSPLSVHEALAAGRPVLASSRGGLPELLEDGENGYLFDPMQIDSVAEALGWWETLHPNERRSMGKRARKRAVAGGPEAWLPRLIGEYRKVIL